MATNQHGLMRLTWNQVNRDEWRAGGITRNFTIIEYADPLPIHYALRAQTGENQPISVGVFSSLKQAQFRAQRILDDGIGK